MKFFEEFVTAASLPAEEGRALPLQVYSDPEFYEQEKVKIFHEDWVFVCNSQVIKEAGDRFAVIIADEPVVVVRGRDGQLRALSNVCRHRGTLLADDGFSNASSLVCPYHSWNFSDTGELKGAPYTGATEIDKAAHCLPQFALEEWCGLLFVNISGTAEPLKDRYAFMQPHLEAFNAGNYTYGVENAIEHWDSNWKLVIENAMESYHLFKVHKPTLETVTPTKGAFYVEGNALGTLTAGEQVRVRDVVKGLLGKVEKRGPDDHYLLVSLPPSFVGIMQLDGSFGYLAMLPEGPGKTYARGGVVSQSAFKQSKAEEEFTTAFFEEDKWICERAYKGMHSQHGRGGQLVELERIVQDFHRYLAVRLAGVDVGATHRNDDDVDNRLNSK